ncbi:MAG: DMT family transporter [Xanthomonadales bacterium]|nr:DMT family transporter [Xanthomonadales bacterium]
MGWGEFFALSSALVWALAVILFRRSGETLPAFELNLFKNFFGLILLVPTILLVEGLGLPDYTSTELVLVFVSGLIGIAVADTWYLKALNMMGASRTGIVSSLFSPFVILLSAVFLGERLVPWQWLGFVFVMSGVLLVTWRSHRSAVDTADLKKGVMYGVGAVFMMAAGVVMVKDILETGSFLWTVELRVVGGISGMLVYMLVSSQWQRVKRNFSRPQPWGTVMFASFLGAYFALILWLLGYKLIDASVASVLNETNVAFIVFLAWLMLGEKINRRKLAGLGLTLCGVIIMMSV